MTILRSYQASSLLPEKIINPYNSKQSYHFSTQSKEKDEEEFCEKIHETINDLDNNYASDDENGEKTRAYRKRQNTLYQPSKALQITLSTLIILYVCFIYLFIYLFIFYLFIYLFIYLFLFLYISLFIYFFFCFVFCYLYHYLKYNIINNQ